MFLLCVIQLRNYSLNKTSNERFAKTARTQSATSDLDNTSSYNSSVLRDDESALLSGNAGGRSGSRRQKGCWMNCREMCCNKQVVSQDRLMQIYLAEASESSHTSMADE